MEEIVSRENAPDNVENDGKIITGKRFTISKHELLIKTVAYIVLIVAMISMLAGVVLQTHYNSRSDDNWTKTESVRKAYTIANAVFSQNKAQIIESYNGKLAEIEHYGLKMAETSDSTDFSYSSSSNSAHVIKISPISIEFSPETIRNQFTSAIDKTFTIKHNEFNEKYASIKNAASNLETNSMDSMVKKLDEVKKFYNNQLKSIFFAINSNKNYDFSSLFVNNLSQNKSSSTNGRIFVDNVTYSMHDFEPIGRTIKSFDKTPNFVHIIPIVSSFVAMMALFTLGGLAERNEKPLIDLHALDKSEDKDSLKIFGLTAEPCKSADYYQNL